jgi:hypothetical protein
MSQYQKSCNFCKSEIKMSNDSGTGWRPMNLDGTAHRCVMNTQQTGTKKVAKELSLEDRVKRLEQIVLDPRS